ncbi:hypothetical protein NCCP691_24140 [Noviherbaspirillum aridicola]|uniref:Uncharacterized protein n=1 Tax=Noviherbaspirillum aridicola TaxID=2849687 RepID=A0ABQ4Q6H3_9BURK|nr:hypothetical protein NCCP691_24140 [Noviherbaspirillum aridicola]
MPGGQPSTTQPMPAPCDSPKVVTEKSVPKVLPDIGKGCGLAEESKILAYCLRGKEFISGGVAPTHRKEA